MADNPFVILSHPSYGSTYTSTTIASSNTASPTVYLSGVTFPEAVRAIEGTARPIDPLDWLHARVDEIVELGYA